MKKNICPAVVYPLNNGYVSDLKPTIHGTGEPKATINGELDAVPFSASVSDNGVWSYIVEAPLADVSEHNLCYSQLNTGGELSPQASLKFRTDTQLLVSHTLSYPSNGQFINTRTPIFTGTGKPSATIELNLSGSVYNTVVNPDGSWQIHAENLPEGYSFMHVIQKDMGNVSPAICVGFTVDTVVPAEPVVDFPYDQSFINNPMPIFSGKGEPNASIAAIVDEKKYVAAVNAQGKWSFEASEALLDDTHIISTRQIDRAGNISTEKICIFTVKTMQPRPPVITSPSNGAILSYDSPVLSGLGDKGCVVAARVYGSVSTALVEQDGSWKMKLSEKFADGAHTLKIYQVDSAGNVSPGVALTLRIDTTIPSEPVIIYPEKSGYVLSPNFCVKGTGEPDATITCNVANREYKTRVSSDGSWTVDLSGNTDVRYKINYSISAFQTDLAGNTSKAVKTEFYVDSNRLQAPEINYPANNSSINTATPLITGTGRAGAVLNLCLNGKAYTTKVASNGTWSINLYENLPIGPNTATLTQTEFGNTSPQNTVTFKVSLSVPPCPVITVPGKKQIVYDGSFTVRGSGLAGSVINIKLDDACYTTKVSNHGTWEYSVTNMLQGLHSLLVSQTDPAGNASQYAHVDFVSCPSQPNLSYAPCPTSYQLFYNPPGPELTGKTIATLKTSNPITVNNVFGNVFSMVISENGIYNFCFSEPGGGSGVVTAGVSWIDSKAPVIQLDSCGNYFSGDKTVSYYKYGGSRIKNALINGLPFESGRKVCDEGVYSVEITDTAGNLATETFFIDKTTPTVCGIENGAVYNSNVAVNYHDGMSGVRSAELNGTNILPGTVLTENGNYTLTVTDYADNASSVSFSIQK